MRRLTRSADSPLTSTRHWSLLASLTSTNSLNLPSLAARIPILPVVSAFLSKAQVNSNQDDLVTTALESIRIFLPIAAHTATLENVLELETAAWEGTLRRGEAEASWVDLVRVVVNVANSAKTSKVSSAKRVWPFEGFTPLGTAQAGS
jgi:hypothetical protein